MIILNKCLSGLCLAAVCFGCASTLTPAQVVKRAGTVNYADGIDRDEAVLIAQKYLVENNLDARLSLNNVEQVVYDPAGSRWTVHFGGVIERGAVPYRRFGFTPSGTVLVDARTGWPSLAE